MHQPITLAKVRKAQTIKVPAGGWIILVSPDESFDKHHNKRKSLAVSPINNEYETVVCGRVDNKYADLKLRTVAEQQFEEARVAEYEESLSKSIKDATARQTRFDASSGAAARAAHEKRVAELNKSHDAIRNQAGIPVPVPLIPPVPNALSEDKE